jgi:hypothetical protein
MTKPIVIALALGMVLMFQAAVAVAGNRQQVLRPAQYGMYAPGYRPYMPQYGPTVRLYLYADPWTAYYGSDPHSEAVRRIMAEHSRNRWYTHPRSLYNSPPPRFGWGGWVPGY